MCRRWFIAALVVLGACVATEHSWEMKKARREMRQAVHGDTRVVDYGVHLRVVVKDPNGEQLIPESPRLRVVREYHFGGLYDTALRVWCGQSTNETEWLCSVEQEPLILHGEELPPWIYFLSGFGVGKSTGAGMWGGLQIIKTATLPIAALKGAGVTSVTGKRMESLRRAILGPKDENGIRMGGVWPAHWGTWREGDGVYTTRTGLQIDFQPTHAASAALGSPLQGQNWPIFEINDELQDYYQAESYLQARGRGGGRVVPRFATVTPKSDPGYRDFQELVEKSPDWHVAKVSALTTPFLSDDYWAVRKRNMTAVAWAREVLGEDVPSENRIYFAFDRKENVRPRPVIGARDVTNVELGRFGFQDTWLLQGHDPGLILDYTLIVKAFQLPQRDPKSKRLDDPVWWVIGELETQGGTEIHCSALSKLVRSRWNVRTLTHMDPHGVNQTNDDERPDITARKTFIKHGFPTVPAAYSPGKSTPGQVPREAGIEMVNMLLCNAQGERRLFIDTNPDGTPVAPKLVKALESQERDVAGRAERGRKGIGDLTHYTAALRYALWPIEKVRLADIRSMG